MKYKKGKTALIIGAGVAGLSAAYYLVKHSKIRPIIIETESCLGGLAKTFDYEGLKADIGPHRFFTKNKDVMNLWTGILSLQSSCAKDDIILNRKVNFSGIANPENDDCVLLKRRRFSRIYYKQKFFDYPVKINLCTILNIGLIKTMMVGLSYVKSCVFKQKENNLEDFMINRFGRVLYEMFFEFYTQKVWGRHPKNISKDWGEQRIKGLSLLKTILNKFSYKKETSLIEEYFYPKLGAGQMWEEMSKTIVQNGGEIHLNTKVLGVNINNNKILSLKVQNENNIYDLFGDYVISSMPLKDFINGMDNVVESLKQIADGLKYRDYQLISFKVNDFNLKNNTDWATINNICPDSWIYIQDREVNAGRIYIPKNFSPYLSNDINDTLICMEYFCDKGDYLWNMSDDEIYQYAIEELKKIKAIKSVDNVEKSYRLKVEKAYPAYFDTYKDFEKLKDFLNTIENLYCIGRNGQHKYNNMDHSVLSGITAAHMIIEGINDKSSLWEINTEQSYQEKI